MPLLLGNTASAGAAEVVTAGLITHLDASKPASYTSGSTWFDISGNGNNASINGGVSYSTNNGGYFNLNNSGYFQLSSNSAAAPYALQTFTIDMWVLRYEDSANYEILWSQDYTTHSPPYYSVHIRYDNSSAHGVTSMGGTPFGPFNPTPNGVVNNAWNHFIFAKDNAAGSVKTYRNGTLLDERSAGGLTYYSNPLWVGKSNFNPSSRLHVGSVRYYNRALTAGEAAINFAATKTRFGL